MRRTASRATSLEAATHGLSAGTSRSIDAPGAVPVQLDEGHRRRPGAVQVAGQRSAPPAPSSGCARRSGDTGVSPASRSCAEALQDLPGPRVVERAVDRQLGRARAAAAASPPRSDRPGSPRTPRRGRAWPGLQPAAASGRRARHRSRPGRSAPRRGRCLLAALSLGVPDHGQQPLRIATRSAVSMPHHRCPRWPAASTLGPVPSARAVEPGARGHAVRDRRRRGPHRGAGRPARVRPTRRRRRRSDRRRRHGLLARPGDPRRVRPRCSAPSAQARSSRCGPRPAPRPTTRAPRGRLGDVDAVFMTGGNQLKLTAGRRRHPLRRRDAVGVPAGRGGRRAPRPARAP